MTPYPIIVDFETDGIIGNPIINPPKPCGVAIKWPGHASNYFAWGHPTNNNCSAQHGAAALDQVIKSGLPVCFQNAGFDIRVWSKYFDESYWDRFDWRSVHDTLYLVFLADPYAPSFSLKPSAERWLNLPPNEQDEVKAWILTNVPEAGLTDWAAYISRAPGDLVGKYGCGDTDRTDGLYRMLLPRIVEQGMGAAYDRERRMFPITYNATIRGIRCDRDRLLADTTQYTQALDQAEDRLCRSVGITRYQLEDDEEALKDGLEHCGAVTEWVLTPKSKKRSIAQDNLRIINPEIRGLLDYRGALKTCLQTFMRPWLEHSRVDGRLHPNWNQVRQAKGDFHSKGARTGRLSSDDPSVMNIPTEWEYRDGTPMPVPAGLLPYPIVRSYMLPEVGHVWCKRDFSGQEFRILAHFEDGALKQAYVSDPNMDPHTLAKEMILALVGMQMSRQGAKITGFSIVYGSGGPGLSKNLHVPVDEARRFKSAYLAAMPGVADLMQDVQTRGRTGLGVRTWGGRVYFSEPPKLVGGQMRDFHYKLLNYLIQGSAADQTKDCINEWDDHRGHEAVFLATVHDEINISAPAESADVHMAFLRTVMERDRFDVPFKTDGFVGPNWAALEACA